jgi:hypothetical protein
MQRLRIVSQDAEQEVVGLRGRARDGVLEHVPDIEFLEIKSSGAHDALCAVEKVVSDGEDAGSARPRPRFLTQEVFL